MHVQATEFYPANKPWVESKTGVRLAGGICAECDVVCFPIAANCPTCGAQAMKEHMTGTDGRLYSYTVVHTGPRQFGSPYAVGYVDMDDGLRLFAQIERSAAELKLDARMELFIGEVSKGIDQPVVISYKFREVV